MGTLKTQRRSRGFTLVEILTVVLILGIASAIIAPQIGSRDDLKARAGARLLVADLIYAQNMAIAHQKWHYVRFDAANESYQLMDAAGPSGADHVITHPINKTDYVTQLGPAGGSHVTTIRIKSAVFNGVDTGYGNEFTLAFDELGTPHVFCYDQPSSPTDEMANGTVVLECGNFEISVVVERYTGEIKVQ